MVLQDYSDTQTVLLVDGTNLLLRVLFSRGKENLVISPNEMAESCALIFLGLVVTAVKKHKANRLYIAFDSGGSLRKKNILESYKANREIKSSVTIGSDSDPDTYLFVTAKETTLKLCRLFNIPIFMESGVEADDMIGVAAEELSKLNKTVVVLSNDSDFLQLLRYPSVICSIPYKKTEVTRDTFTNFFSSLSKSKGIDICSAEYLFYKAVVGDPGDNIPGIRGIGYKTLHKLMTEQFKSEPQAIITGYLQDGLEYVKLLAKRNSTKLEKLININYDIVERNYKLIELSSVTVSSHVCIKTLSKIREVSERPNKKALIHDLRGIIPASWTRVNPLDMITNTLFSLSTIYVQE